jgi:Tfp pilus assembly protein PilZ
MKPKIDRSLPAKRSRRRLTVHFGHDQARHIGYSGNVSSSGMMIRTTRVYGPGTVIHLEIDLAKRILRLKGRVVWARAGEVRWLPSGRIGMGVKFINAPEGLMDLLAPIALPE